MYTITLLFIYALLSSNPIVVPTSKIEIAKEVSTKFPVNISLTSREGCKFEISGNYNMWSGFTGTVVASGPGDCPNDTWTFGIIWSNNDDPTPIGENEFTRYLLDHPDDLNMIAEAIKNAQ